MANLARDPGGGAILPAPACDLLDRFTADLGIEFTLTDLHGAVVASTAGRRAGAVDPVAVSAAQAGEAREEEGAAGPAAGPAVYVPVRLSGRVAGVLIGHGPPAERGVATRIAAVSIGLALDFAEAAAALGREHLHPGWILYRLLRGSRVEAQQARVIASVIGWNLFVPRVAIAVQARPGGREGGAGPLEAIERLLGPRVGATPFGQVDETQWVLLVECPGRAGRRELRQLAESIRGALRARGREVAVGIGEPHSHRSPVQAVRGSYRDAVFAARLGARLHGAPGVYELRSLGPAAFFAPGSPSRRNLANSVLEPLSEHPAVLETLRSFLASDMSVARTATLVRVHRHTVRNHLERVTQVTGLDPRALDGAVQLKLALLVAASEPATPGGEAA